MRLGVREFFGSKPDLAMVQEVVSRLRLERSEDPSAKPMGSVVSVVGAKGGVGATTVACQLAACLQAHEPTVLIDLDLTFGDVGLYHDVRAPYTLADVQAGEDALDATYLHTLMQPHPSGLKLLLSPERFEDSERLETRNLERAIGLLRSELSWVVLDLPRDWCDTTLRALELSDLIIMVSAYDVPVLHHTKRQIELFEELGCRSKLRLVANRAGGADSIGDREVREFLARTPDASLPNDFKTTLASIERGRSIREVGEGTALDRSYRSLAEQVYGWCGKPQPLAPKRSGHFARLLKPLTRRLHGAA
jgi:pilus assembly protein CpaE